MSKLIKINLAPFGELVNKTWYVADVIVALTIGLGAYLYVQNYLNGITNKIEITNEKIAKEEQTIDSLKPEIARFKTLSDQVTRLQQKIKSINQITVSKIDKYLPVVIVEILQNIKPYGLWFSYYSGSKQNNHMSITGGAIDSVTIAKFIENMKELEFKAIDDSDLLTSIYFTDVVLEKVNNANISSLENSLDNLKKDISKKDEKPEQSSENSSSKWQDTHKYFPELKEFPNFSMKLKYKIKEKHNNQKKAIEVIN